MPITPVKKLLFGCVILCACHSAFAQKLATFKEHCGLYYKTMEDLLKQQEKQLSFYDFRKGQTVASIGAQCCHWEAAYAAATEDVHFYLEDIDSAYLNKRQADFAWNYYSTLRKDPLTPYTLVLGDEQQTKLPDNTFDKIIIINSFHEFTYVKKMLDDIRLKLKPDGVLYIDEALARHSGQLHGICKKRMYLDEELVALLKRNGYEYVDGLTLNYRKSKPVRKIFAFRKA